jgi:hypothetical protein
MAGVWRCVGLVMHGAIAKTALMSRPALNDAAAEDQSYPAACLCTHWSHHTQALACTLEPLHVFAPTGVTTTGVHPSHAPVKLSSKLVSSETLLMTTSQALSKCMLTIDREAAFCRQRG